MEILLLGNNTDKDDPAKVSDKSEGSFQHIQCSYCEEAYNIKQQEEETVGQLYIRLTNVLLNMATKRPTRQ